MINEENELVRSINFHCSKLKSSFSNDNLYSLYFFNGISNIRTFFENLFNYSAFSFGFYR